MCVREAVKNNQMFKILVVQGICGTLFLDIRHGVRLFSWQKPKVCSESNDFSSKLLLNIICISVYKTTAFSYPTRT